MRYAFNPTTDKRLRSCSAFVRTVEYWNHYILYSYGLPVAEICYLDGEIVDNYGQVFTANNRMYIVLNSDYDYSVTTMSHVRKFIEDYYYYRYSYNISELRELMKNPQDSNVVYLDFD